MNIREKFKLGFSRDKNNEKNTNNLIIIIIIQKTCSINVQANPYPRLPNMQKCINHRVK